jgi:hypothetical protein
MKTIYILLPALLYKVVIPKVILSMKLYRTSKTLSNSISKLAKHSVNALLSASRVEKQGYHSCTSLMKLADQYSLSRFEEACQRALSYTPSPSFKTIQTILKTGQDRISIRSVRQKVTKDDPNIYGFVRGAGYYGGKDND